MQQRLLSCIPFAERIIRSLASLLMKIIYTAAVRTRIFPYNTFICLDLYNRTDPIGVRSGTSAHTLSRQNSGGTPAAFSPLNTPRISAGSSVHLVYSSPCHFIPPTDLLTFVGDSTVRVSSCIVYSTRSELYRLYAITRTMKQGLVD